MNSSIISKIQKAHEYAKMPDRIALNGFTASFRGDNRENTVSLSDGKWHCTCSFFADWNVCAHSMAFEKIMQTAGIRVPIQPSILGDRSSEMAEAAS